MRLGISSHAYGGKLEQRKVLKMTSQNDEFIDTAALARMLALSKSYLEKMRMRREGPDYIKVRNRVWYRRSAIEAWLSNHEVKNEEFA